MDGKTIEHDQGTLPPWDDEGIPIPSEETETQQGEPLFVPGGDAVRIGLSTGNERIEVGAECPIQILDLRGKSYGRDLGPGRIHIARARRGLVLDGPGFDALGVPGRGVILRGKKGEACFSSGGNVYAGDALIERQTDGRLALVNVVDLESYLRGVIPWEIGRPGRESLEAVKAQAIAARTYTVAHLGRREDLGFDLWDNVADQVYRGLTGISAVTDRAVGDTRAEVLRYEGKIVQAYYSSTCGGHTSAIQDVWPREPVPYLQGVRDAPEGEGAWCQESPHFRWTVAWSALELGEIIRAHLPVEVDPRLSARQVGVLEGLEVLERDRSGRVRRLRVKTSTGSWEVVGDRIRWVLRPAHGRFEILRSTLFRLQEYRDADGVLIGVRLQGGGNGHGIGMCQSGALAMARAGRSSKQILQHYYPGTQIESLHGGREEWARER
jgi:stage II sporulation protein D